MRAIVLSGSLNIITNDFAISGSNKLPAAFAATMLGDRALIAWRNDNGGGAAALVDTRGNVTPLDLLIDDAFIAPALASSGSDDARLLWYTGAHSLNAMELDANGKPPTCAKLRAAAALVQQGDAFAIRNGVACCLRELKRTQRIQKYTVGRTNFVGPEGNCGGVELIFKFELV